MDEEEIPIDIQCNKLVDWLIDRRHCSIKWQTAAEVVKEKISSALLDMPSTEEMRKLLEGSCFHYFKCQKIVNVLKDTEKDSKNIFGRYSSKRMKDWQEIVKLYEKENLHLAELSSRLLRNLNYEIPATKRQISKCGQVQEECQKKIQDCERNIREVERRYFDECRKVGIDGKNIRKELLDLVSDLPNEFDVIAKNCKDLLPMLQYYSAFVEFSLSSAKFSDATMPMLRHVCNVGNTTVYQWKYGVLPDRVVKEEHIATITETDEVSKDQEIDWGAGEVEEIGSNDVIDFDIDAGDLGIVVENSGEGENDKQTGDNGFEIVADKEKQKWEIEEVSITEVPNGSKLVKEERVAEGKEAMTLLECVDTRTEFINELIEVSSFLAQRLVETRKEGDVLSINQFQTAPPVLQLTSVCDLEEMQTQILAVYNTLTSPRMTQLCRILDSPRYVDRIAENLNRQHSLTKKYESMRKSYQDTIERSQSEETFLRPKLTFLIQETKEWKKLIESEISKRYKNRRVNLMGQINLL